jgi:mannose-1-phosphate guanylyltransferase
VQPVILCGGQGLRLWPYSNKPLIKLADAQSMLDKTILRVAKVSSYSPLLVCTQDFPLPTQYEHYSQLVEPYTNDTGVAIARIAHHYADQKSVLLLILPADNYITNEDVFVNDIKRAINQYKDGITLFGIPPTYESSSYGYILPVEDKLLFREKPVPEQAANYIKRGAYWNSGMLLVNNHVLYQSIPSDLTQVVVYPQAGKYPSFDVAVLQNYNNLTLFKSNHWGWSDVGSWKELISLLDNPNKDNVVINECCDVQVHNVDNLQVVITDVKNLIVIIKDGKLLISNSKDDSSVKTAVSKICK